jgi:hypothetical protein
MSGAVQWYRSARGAPPVAPSLRRRVRNRIRSWLPEPRVRGKTIVLVSRRTFPTWSRAGLRSRFHGIFSEFHSVLGALAYAGAHGASGVRVDFASPLYVDPAMGPNWWTYFFEDAAMPLDADRLHSEGDVRLDGVLAKYGRHGGFSDLVQGETPYLYPMTRGIARGDLHRLMNQHIRVRQDVREEVARFVDAHFDPGAFVVGVHYRGTDATHSWGGALTHYRTAPVPYRAYADEVRRTLAEAAPRTYQLFVATDEEEFPRFMAREFPDRVVCVEHAPRARAGGEAVHLDRTLPVSNYLKGRSAMVDCLLLAACGYLVKGRSNLSDASLLFSPALPYSFCPDAATLL